MNISSIRENTKLAMDTLVTHRFRAALTILGVFLGVCVIVLMAPGFNGFRQTIVDQTEGFGTRNIYLWRYPFIQMGRMSTDVLNRKPLTLEDSKAIEEGVDAAEYVAPGMAFNFAPPRSEERRVGKECRSRCDWSSDVSSSDLLNRKPLTLEDSKAIEEGVDAAEYVAPGMAFNFAPP